jgi:hypothetical protein
MKYNRGGDLRMGVWHLGGLGKNPGAITVPLTYIYMALKAASLKDETAKEFFEFSGEYAQELKGAPEGLILFTSKEVIEGSIGGNLRDEWFKTGDKSIPEVIAKYLSKLLEWLRDSNFTPFYDNEWIKEIYLVKVYHDNFDDCYSKIGITVKALREKEIWANMIGGSNQINSALLVAGSLFAAIQRYYYIFQSETDLLHPETNKPDLKSQKSIVDIVQDLHNKWQELPIFHLDTGSIISRLDRLFEERGQIVNINEVKKILTDLNYPEMYLSKLRGKLIVIKGNERVMPGPILNKLSKMVNEIDSNKVENLSNWKDWASQNKILYRLTLDGNCKKV